MVGHSRDARRSTAGREDGPNPMPLIQIGGIKIRSAPVAAEIAE